jgi:hypothetical protein
MLESKPMKTGELGRFVCVAQGGCLHSPKRTIDSDGVWARSPDPQVPGSYMYSSAHRDCFEAWQRRERKAPAPETGIIRDTDGTILRGPSRPCGCPLDSGCDGFHIL